MIITTDIDGVLNYYPKDWLCFLNNKNKTKFSNIDIAKKEMPDAYDTTKHLWRISKEKYRQDYNKSNIAYLNSLKAKFGAHLIVVTSRPMGDFNDMYEKTLLWLNAVFRPIIYRR